MAAQSRPWRRGHVWIASTAGWHPMTCNGKSLTTMAGTSGRADMAWKKRRRPLVGEADGAGPHSLPDALFKDRRRANNFVGAGVDIVRFTWRDARQIWMLRCHRSICAAGGPWLTLIEVSDKSNGVSRPKPQDRREGEVGASGGVVSGGVGQRRRRRRRGRSVPRGRRR